MAETKDDMQLVHHRYRREDVRFFEKSRLALADETQTRITVAEMFARLVEAYRSANDAGRSGQTLDSSQTAPDGMPARRPAE